MNPIEISPERILKDAPVVVKIRGATLNGEAAQLQLSHSGGKVEVPLRWDRGFWLGEFTLGQPGEYVLIAGSETVPFRVHEREDLSFGSEFIFLTICVGVILLGLIRWDWKKKN